MMVSGGVYMGMERRLTDRFKVNIRARGEGSRGYVRSGADLYQLERQARLDAPGPPAPRS